MSETTPSRQCSISVPPDDKHICNPLWQGRRALISEFNSEKLNKIAEKINEACYEKEQADLHSFLMQASLADFQNTRSARRKFVRSNKFSHNLKKKKT